MGKRKKLTEVEKFYVENNINSVSIDEMAKKLDCTKTVLVPFYQPPKSEPVQSAQVPEPAKEPIKTGPETVAPVFPKGMVRGAFARRRTAVVMTPAAAEMGDEIRAKSGKKKNNPNQIHKPYGDE